MPYTSALDAAAARRAIAMGDDNALERYLREGTGGPTIAATGATANGAAGGGTTIMNRATGVALTLPKANGTQEKHTVIVQTTFSGGNGVVKVSNSVDSMVGSVTMTTATLGAGSVQAAPAGSDTITMNGTTTGGAAGSQLTLTDIAPATWLVEGTLVCVGAAATPFSNAV